MESIRNICAFKWTVVQALNPACLNDMYLITGWKTPYLMYSLLKGLSICAEIRTHVSNVVVSASQPVPCMEPYIQRLLWMHPPQDWTVLYPNVSIGCIWVEIISTHLFSRPSLGSMAPPSWATPAQLEFLNSHYASFLDHQKCHVLDQF